MKALKFAAALFFVACSAASATTVVPIGMLDPAVAPKSYVDSAIATEVTNRNSAITSAIAAAGVGAAGGKAANRQVFTANGTWTKPTGFGANAVVLIEAWGGGGAGASSSTYAGGGGGGAYSYRWILLSSLPATVSVTVGAGGTTGVNNGAANNGGNSTFGTYLTAYGGGGGGFQYGGSGAGWGGAGSNVYTSYFSTQSATLGGKPYSAPKWIAVWDGASTNTWYTQADDTFGGGSFMVMGTDFSTNSGNGHFMKQGSSVYGGGAGTVGGQGGDSVFGGAGGGGHYTTTQGVGGTSREGGNGGIGSLSGTGAAGSAPAGGGGGGVVGGAGGRGEVRITVLDGA
jgi:hypothetical protein